MTNNPEIRAAMQSLYRAHVAMLWEAAEISKALPAGIVGDSPFLKLCDAIDAESDALRALAAHIEPPNTPLQDMYRTVLKHLEGMR
jgi:hypothetical protein